MANKGVADWKFVYIAEAHAQDEWPIRSARFNHGRGAVIVEKQPKKAAERCELARKFVEDFMPKVKNAGGDISMLVDDPELGDPFEKQYAPWPLRLYLIRDGVVEWIAQPKDCSYDEAVVELCRILGVSVGNE